MASKGIEMATSSPRRKKDGDTFTYWQLYERAAKQRFGQNIRVIKTKFYEDKVNNIDFQLKIIHKDPEPSEKTRTIVDVNMKEFINHGQTETDESLVQIQKTSSKTSSERYTFSTTKGVSYGVGGNIGVQVMAAAVAGGSIGISGHYDRSKTKTEGTEKTTEENTAFSYNQEEKIKIPPGTRVEAKITTFSMKYESSYTVKLSIDKDATIPVIYRTSCQNLFGSICRNSGVVYVRDMISILPDYNPEDEDETASYTQVGAVSWVGEGCSVDKVERPLPL